jgi:hypothetical protein
MVHTTTRFVNPDSIMQFDWPVASNWDQVFHTKAKFTGPKHECESYVPTLLVSRVKRLRQNMPKSLDLQGPDFHGTYKVEP